MKDHSISDINTHDYFASFWRLRMTLNISGSSLSDQWPALQSLCSKVVMVLSRSFLTNQWEQVVHNCNWDYIKYLYVCPVFQIELLTKSKCIIILLEDLTSLDLASVPKLNFVLQQNTVLRYYIQKVVEWWKKF